MLDQVSSALIKELREKTSAGIVDCKKALVEAKGDIGAAVDLLRKRGIASAAKKSCRVAKEGAVAVHLSDDGMEGAIVELNSETDFVSKNDRFQSLIKKLVRAVHGFGEGAFGGVEAFHDSMLDGATVRDIIAEQIAVIGENIALRRADKVMVRQNGTVAMYVHNAMGDCIGKVGVLVVIESSGDRKKLAEFGKKIAMHVAAFKPEALTIADVDQSVVEKEREILREQACSSGKSADIVEKMIDGRLRKLYKEIVLLEQQFVMDNSRTVNDVVNDFSKEIGAPVAITSFVRFGLGEWV